MIDKETRDQTRISLSIDFPLYIFHLHYWYFMFSLPCDLIQVGYRDALGNERSDIDNEIFKTNLDVNGNPIGKRDKTKVDFICISFFTNR